MRSRLDRRVTVLYAIAFMVIVAAVVLGGYSLRYAAQVALRSESSLVESNRLLGEQMLQRIDNAIIDNDRAMFDLVDLEHPADFQRTWSYIIRVSPAVEAAAILDESLQIVPGGYVSKKRVADAEAFRELFLARILPDLDLGKMKQTHKHLHKAYEGRDYLISYIKREREDRVYYVVLKISLEYVLRVLLPQALDSLQGKVLFAVRDDEGRVVYGADVGSPGKFLFERAFPTTLYLWRLQLAPTPAEALTAGERVRRRSEYLLITLTLAILFAGLGFLLYATSKERRANQLKSDFISNVSHELKTPLSLIRMFGELLALGKLKSPDKGREYAEIITRESERLSRLIDNVLDFARMERGSAYEFQKAQLDEVVERALDVYRQRVEREGIRLTTKIDAELPATYLDENAMTLLLLNLVENAIKYGVPPRGPQEIRVYLTRVESRLRLVVEDNGPGVDATERKKIFERFYRTRQARATSVRGAGIGLSLVKHIAEAHGGGVSVESEPGRGAAFIVDLPIEVPTREAA
jgi:two-component system phosphate regulon sensor histidine kinase PhoR